MIKSIQPMGVQNNSNKNKITFKASLNTSGINPEKLSSEFLKTVKNVSKYDKTSFNAVEFLKDLAKRYEMVSTKAHYRTIKGSSSLHQTDTGFQILHTEGKKQVTVPVPNKSLFKFTEEGEPAVASLVRDVYYKINIPNLTNF